MKKEEKEYFGNTISLDFFVDNNNMLFWKIYKIEEKEQKEAGKLILM